MSSTRINLPSVVLALALVASVLPHPAQAGAAEVDELIEQLQQGDPDAQRAAASELAHQAAFAGPAVPVLIEALESDDPELRLASARTLGTLSSSADAAVPALIDLLAHDPEPSVRALAAWSLGQFGVSGQQSAPALVEAATDEDPLVRRSALRALQRLHIEPGELREVWVQVLRDSEPTVILPALHSLAEMGAQGVPALTDALEDPDAAYWACLVLAEIGPEAAPAAPALAELASSDNPETRMQAIMALAEIGAAAEGQLPEIETALDDDHEAVRYAAIYAIGRIGTVSAAGEEKIRAMLDHSDEFLQMMSAWALAGLHPDDEATVQLAVDQLLAGMQSEDRNVRSAAVTALVEGDFPPDIVRPALLAVLNDIDPQVLAIGMQALVEQGAAAVPRLSAALENEQLRPLAVEALRRIGPDAADAVPELIALAQGDDLRMAAEAQFTLAAIGPAAIDAVPVLTESLASEDRLVRNSACYALGKIGSPDEAAQRALVDMVKEAETPEQKLPPVWALLQMRPDSQHLKEFALPLLLQGLESQAEIIRVESAVSLGQLGDVAQEALDALRQAQFDHSPRVRQAAAEAIQAIEG